MKNHILEKLKKDILSDDYDVRTKASDKLGKIGGRDIVKHLISLLKNKNVQIRDSAALSLRSIRDGHAIKPLVDAIKNPKYKKNNGILVYALETLDCSELFLFMVKLALYGDYEVQCHALTILKKQKFKATEKEIKIAEKMVEEYLESDQKCSGYELLIDEMSRYLKRIKNGLYKGGYII